LARFDPAFSMIALNGSRLDFAALSAFSVRIGPPNRGWQSA
jgi:hypothetical protein